MVHRVGRQEKQRGEAITYDKPDGMCNEPMFDLGR